MFLRKGLTALSRFWMNWPLWGGAITALLSAKHVWVLLAPRDQAIPANLVGTPPAKTASLFGVPSSTAKAAILNDVRLAGIFHHRQKGFAILKTPSGQVVVAVGEKTASGLRLVETHPDYVILERNGTRHRVNLDGPVFQINTSSSAQSPVHGMTVPPAGRHLLDPLTPEQKMILQQLEEIKQRNQP